MVSTKREPFQGQCKKCDDCEQMKEDTVEIELGMVNYKHKFRLCIDCCRKFTRIVDDYERTNWRMLRKEILADALEKQRKDRGLQKAI